MRPRLPDPRFLLTILFLSALLLYAAFPSDSDAATWVHLGTFTGAKGVSAEEYYAPATVQ